MQWWIVEMDAEGDADYAEPAGNTQPTEQELQDWTQLVGYRYAGCYQAETETDAIAQALAHSDEWSHGGPA